MFNRFLRQLSWLALTSTLFVLGGCATSPSVWVDYSPSANFAQYKTFAFTQPLGTDRDGYQSILSQRLIAATQRELEARGLRRVGGSAQLSVNFEIMQTEKIQYTPIVTPMLGWGFGRGYYGYRSGFYGAWPLYPTQTIATPYIESYLKIDIVDETHRQRVWVGILGDLDADGLQFNVEAAVAAAFAKYPLPLRGLSK